MSGYVASLRSEADMAGWRDAARLLAQQCIPPGLVVWRVGEVGESLFEAPATPVEALRDLPPQRALSVPRAFIELAEQVVCHSDGERFGLLYRLLDRLQTEPKLLEVASDGDVHRVAAMAKAVRRDMHKMTAFVRFREVKNAEGEEAFVAWFEPEHHILERISDFFVKRFASMHWSILTPQGSLHWDGSTLHHGAPAEKRDAPDDDAMEAYWRTYYASIFNPARLKVKAMKAEMPVKYWRNLPEAELIAPLIAGASRRTEEMVVRDPTPTPAHVARRQASRPAEPVPAGERPASWEEARAAAQDCRRCQLWCNATQTVFGEGPLDAPVIFVGEQPGDQEDLAGRPFVGPAGRMFDHALGQAGLDRSRAYVTNAVKHFKFSLRGKRRIHEKPNAGEVKACRFWLESEFEFLKPQLVVALGATALSALTGRTGSLSSARGQDLVLPGGQKLLATVHPSYLLRLPDEEAKARETERFIADLVEVGDRVPAMRALAA